MGACSDPAVVNQRSRGGVTALILVAGDGHPEMVQALLDAGADPAAEIPGGHTALSIAVAGGAFTDIDRPLLGGWETETVRTLLGRAPELSLRNDSAGRYGRFFARLKGCDEILALLQNPSVPIK